MIPLKTRLSFIHGRVLSDDEIKDFTSAGGASESSKLAIENVGKENLKQLDGVNDEYLAELDTKSYFSAMEFSQVIPIISPSMFEELIDFPSISINDKIRGEQLTFDQIEFMYIYTGKIEKKDEIHKAYNLRSYKIDSEIINILWPLEEFLELQLPSIPLLKKQLKSLPSLPVFRDKIGHKRIFLPGRIDVWFRDVSENQIKDVLKQAKLKALPQKDSERKHGLWRTKFLEDNNVNTMREMNNALEKLSSFDEVLYAEPDEIGEGDFGPALIVKEEVNAREFLFARTNWNNEATQLNQGHQITRGSKKVTIFVIDSGIDLDHSNIKDALRSDWDDLDLNFDLNASPEERSPAEKTISHGSSVSSLAVGNGKDDGVQGVAPQCSLIPLKINGGSYSAGYGLRAAAILQALSVLRQGERGVINISWKTSGEHIGIREALKKCRDKDVPVIVAAGNYQRTETPVANQILYPAAYVHQYPKLENMLSVGAANINGKRAWYSYYGKDSITVGSPGGEGGGAGSGIRTAKIGGNYHYVFGTSFAAPQVSGLVALLLSLDPNMSAAKAVNIVKQGARALDENYQLGSGLISIIDTLRIVQGSRPFRPLVNRVNINTANLEELVSITGLTEWEAQGIIEYREANGPYKTIWDLLLIGRISFYAIRMIENKIYI